MRSVGRWLRGMFIACFGRTQRVAPMGFSKPALAAARPSRGRVRAAGPALAAFDSEMLAMARGEGWSDPGEWAWLVPVGHQTPPGQPTPPREPDVTPVLPAPAVSAVGVCGQRRREPKTVRWVNRNVFKRGG